MVQTICPAGFFCKMGTAVPSRCEPNQVCPEGSSWHSAGGKTRYDCLPGEYLAINDCKPCIEGFVCDEFTDQKYPKYMDVDGGAECPAGHYCPGGSTTKTAKKCPVGTQRLDTGGKDISDCFKCKFGSAAPRVASTTCVVCGSGSTNSEDFSTCTCNGAFRSWQETSNTCVCLPGYVDPVPVTGDTNNALDLDCVPKLNPVCSTQFNFINEFDECVGKNWCDTYYKCPGNSVYSEDLNNCFCTNVVENPNLYCDATCEEESLRAYITNDRKIVLKAVQFGIQLSKTFEISDFGDSVSLDGLACQYDECLIQSMSSSEGTMSSTQEANPVFVAKWREYYPNYRSPYTDRRVLSADQGNSTARMLQSGGAKPMSDSIQCINVYESISFGVSK